MKTFLPLVVALLAGSALADERYDHRGSIGLLVAVSGERKDAATTTGTGEAGWRGGVEAGLTWNVGSDSNELKAALRLLMGGQYCALPCEGPMRPLYDFALYLGYRGYFDLGQWKTFFDLDAAQHMVPRFNDAPTQLYTIGPRVAVGVQLDFLPVAGAFFLLEGQIGFGDGLRYGAGIQLGFQLRSYLLE